MIQQGCKCFTAAKTNHTAANSARADRARRDFFELELKLIFFCFSAGFRTSGGPLHLALIAIRTLASITTDPGLLAGIEAIHPSLSRFTQKPV
jgi:hypothetical protein